MKYIYYINTAYVFFYSCDQQDDDVLCPNMTYSVPSDHQLAILQKLYLGTCSSIMY